MINKTGKRPRLTIDMTPELRRRIKMAALERDISVAHYVVQILETAVPPLEAAPAPPVRPVTQAVIELMNRTRAAVMRGRTFTDDSVDLIEEARQERLAEL